jgi:hypothetical protein
MPNPVAVNDLSPISGSLQTSRVSYGVETAGKNYGQNYNSSTWYSDIPNNGQFYTIISDNYTANYYVSRSNAGGAYVEGGLPAVDEYSAPVFWITQGTSSLDVITIVNGLPDRVGQVPFNSGSQALNWVASSSNYFAVGPDYYEQVDADQLRLYLHGNQIISYPTTGSSWYDISGYSNNATLYNGLGASWNSNGWFNFDGTDDYGNAGNSSNFDTNTFSIEALVRLGAADNSMRTIASRGGNPGSATNGWWLGTLRNGLGSGINEFRVMYWGTSTYLDLIASVGANNLRWHHVVATSNGTTGFFYIDGVLNTSATLPAGNLYSAGDNFLLGVDDSNGSQWTGSINNEKFYSKPLTAAEVAQNYYGGPIVTSSLYSMLDASNLVSYPKTGTTAYTLTGSVNGTLTNGPSFTPAFGGGWVMDGVDDYLGTAVSSTTITPTNSWTVSIWCSLNSYPTYSGTTLNGVLFGYAYYGGLGIYALTTAASTVNVYGFFRSDSSAALFGGYAWTLNTPTMFTLVHEAGVGCRFYVNGQLNTTSGTTGGNWPSYMPNPFYLQSPQNGIYGGGTETYIYYPITTYSTQVYNNKALTSDEVLQNYNATK